ncbi:MAG: hypothetical protein ACRC8W_19375 [Plesiomonas shigelloides]
MKPLYLRFDNKQAAHDALLANGFELAEDGNLYHSQCEIDIVGVIRGAVTTDNDGNVTHREPDVYGYHVNLLVPDDYVPPNSAAVIDVKTPDRRWAGY